MAQPVRIDVCGTLTVTVEGERCERSIHHQGRLILAFLALNRARPVSREELELAVWGLEDSGDHRSGISSLLSRLRRTLRLDVIENKGRTSVQLIAE